jgi:hypothetical protein
MRNGSGVSGQPVELSGQGINGLLKSLSGMKLGEENLSHLFLGGVVARTADILLRQALRRLKPSFNYRLGGLETAK